MELIMDMVHDNPGESRCDTAFRQPEKLLAYNYNTQVFKHFNTAVTFGEMGEDFFPTEEAKAWLKSMSELLHEDVRKAKEAGLMAVSHIDLFVLPKAMVEKYKDQLCDENGRISIRKEMTRQVHRMLFDEMFETYDLDGVIVRVGETYLHDTPFHTGNGAVVFPKLIEDANVPLEKELFVELLQFLREEICVRHGKYLIYRTWDTKPDRFHADLDYYLHITDKIEPHEKLIFSIKHTALDFWRRVRFNPCLCQGKHRQVVEVQCQREYEGKGAYPSYVMDGVINGFSENKVKMGLKDIASDPHICGIYTWSRGGGWYGPYIKNEFWCDLNTYVISAYAKDPGRAEEEIFLQYATEIMGLSTADAKRFRQVCLKVSDAVLHGRYVEAFDLSLEEKIMPSKLWMRDDRIAGLQRLDPMFAYLEENDLVGEAIAEKALAVSEWQWICDELDTIAFPDETMAQFIRNSAQYGLRLFTIAHLAFRIFAKCRRNENVKELLVSYDAAWESYRQLEKLPQASTSYSEEYIFCPDNLGLNETIAYCREHLCN